MNGYTVTKKKRTDFNHVLLSFAFILIFSAILSPLFIVLPLQEIIYKPTGYWFFGPPRLAFGVFIGGILLLSFVLLGKVWLVSSEKYTKKMKNAFYISVLLSIFMMYLGIDTYRYVDGDAIHVNSLFSFSEKKYNWTDIETATETVNRTKVIFDFTFKNGDKYHILLNEFERKSWSLINFEIEEAGVKLKRHQVQQ
ncbi:MAG TPA: hypothetical protein VEV44_12555 [Pseudoneobacillus sp.]|nr:hypothetical protein [Pseudoneobacillus sp.]